MLIKSQTPLAYNRKNKKGRGRGRRKTWKPPLFFALDAGMTSLLALTCPSYVGWLIIPPILFENAINLSPATQVVKNAYFQDQSVATGFPSDACSIQYAFSLMNPLLTLFLCIIPLAMEAIGDITASADNQILFVLSQPRVK